MIQLWPMKDAEVATWWARILEGIDPPERAFGPECRDPRPRAGDTYYEAILDGLVKIGLVYTRRPALTTRTFGLGLLPACRGRGLGPELRDATLALCFEGPEVWKVETEIYDSNAHSFGALHVRHGRMRDEGIQRDTIRIDEKFHGRVLLGITRDEWEQDVAPALAERDGTSPEDDE